MLLLCEATSTLPTHCLPTDSVEGQKGINVRTLTALGDRQEGRHQR
jgi:hypothetical protein